MRESRRGSVTIFLSLTMLTFLIVCLVLVEGVRVYYLRMEAAQAMDLACFSALSEYQQELFRQYGVFFLDLDYEQGTEQTALLEGRIGTYLEENTSVLQTRNLAAETFCRATDHDGAAFIQQAALFRKTQSGAMIFNGLLEQAENAVEDPINLEDIFSSSLSGIDIALPEFTFPSIRALTEAVLGEEEELSVKEIVLEERLLKRSLKQGTAEAEQIDGIKMQWFHDYLLHQFSYYGCKDSKISRESMEYQLEYMIVGKEKDVENLEQILWRIFLLRAGGDYLLYHLDGERILQAQEKAVAVAGFTGNAAIIEAVKECFLIKDAIESGIDETKQIFAGEKVPLYQDGIFQGIELGYKEYLFLFLNATGSKEKAFRCMDVVELEIRQMSGYENFRMDHCICGFELVWDYGFDSLLGNAGFLNGEDYENTFCRKVDYQR